ncbi:MAG TPA: ABC transporter permease [Longimicrobium sp.]|jgi:predicted permease
MGWFKRFANLGRRDGVTHEIDRELDFHLAELTDELMAGGMSEAEARREARRRFGNPAVQRERTRDVDVMVWLESLGADLRYALRSLRASPGFTLAAVLSLALGIGANTAIFSLVDAVLLRSLPVSRPEELRLLDMDDDNTFSNPTWEQIRDRQDAFSSVAAYSGSRFELARGGESRRVFGAWVSGAYFATLGVAPAAGRLLGAADDRPGCAPVAVLAHSFWQSAYGGDPGVVGRTLSLNGTPVEVVGVAARGFSGVEVGRAERIFVPLCAKDAMDPLGDGGLSEPGHWFLQVIGRRAPGLDDAALATRLAAVAPAVFAATVPDYYPPDARREYLRTKLTSRPAANGDSPLRDSYRTALLALMGVVVLVLMVACANLANLLLVRGTVRRREIAVRIAIGAGRARLIRQLLTESMVLAALGAALGVLFALWSTRLLVSLLSTSSRPVWLDLSLNGRVLAFAAAVTLVTSLLFGLAPAWQAARGEPHGLLRGQVRGTDAALGGGGRRALVVGQIALSMVLVVGAGLLLSTFSRLQGLDPGFDSEGVGIVSVDASARQLTPQARLAMQQELLERLRAMPGVRGAGVADLTPIGGAMWNTIAKTEGFQPAKREDSMVWLNAVGDGYFAAMGTRLLAGRDFGPGDREGSTPVAVINESMARRYFGAAQPVGRRIQYESGPMKPIDVEVVGVVEDAVYRSLRDGAEATMYLAAGQQEKAPLTFVVRTGGDPQSLARPVGALVREAAPGSVFELRALADQVSASLLRERLLATLAGFFGGLALLLAVLGLYGTVAYSVARRSSEIGIRMALGAPGRRVVRMVLGDVVRMVAPGVVLGLALSLALSRFVSSFLYGLEATDPAVMGAAALVLALAALAAGAVPASRAARVDPMVAVRAE